MGSCIFVLILCFMLFSIICYSQCKQKNIKHVCVCVCIHIVHANNLNCTYSSVESRDTYIAHDFFYIYIWLLIIIKLIFLDIYYAYGQYIFVLDLVSSLDAWHLIFFFFYVSILIMTNSYLLNSILQGIINKFVKSIQISNTNKIWIWDNI